MAGVTVEGNMFPFQFEGRRIVIKRLPITVDAIMAGCAVRPIGSDVSLHGGRIDLRVAGRADGLVKRSVPAGVTVLAAERGTILEFGMCL